MAAVQSELTYVTGLTEQYAPAAGNAPSDPEVYMDYAARRRDLQDRLAVLQSRHDDAKDKFEKIQDYLSSIETKDSIISFQNILWMNLVSKCIVNPDGGLQIDFKD